MSSFASPSLKWVLLAILVAANCIDLATSDCAAPQTPDHASLVYERQHASPPRRLRNGYLIRVVCDDLFRLAEGDGFMTCTNGEWSHTFDCTVICDPLEPFPKGEIAYSAGGTIARYSCSEPGYRLEGIRKRRCMSDGTWSEDRPRCRGIPMCETPERIEHGIQRRFSGRRKEGLWIVGSILQFSCEERFTVISENFPALQCTRRGWNATLPRCEEGRCEPLLDTIENGNSSAENRTYAPGEAIEFKCDPGYRTNSPSWRVCNVRRGIGGSIQASWDGVTPECIETRCSRPRRIENGETIVYSVAVNGIAQFRCRSGYALVGEPVIKCQENGQWNATIPVCDNNDYLCPPLAAPLNGYKTGDRYDAYDVVTFRCESNYVLAGSQQRRCLDDGQWSGEDTKCVGNLDFDDVNQISAVLGKSLDRLAINNMFENEAQEPTSDPTMSNGVGRFIPTQHEFGVDLYFAFDSSKSVGEVNFERTKRFAIELVRKIGVSRRSNSLRVGALYFSNHADIAFHTKDFHTTAQIEAAISAIPYIGHGTNIADALSKVRQVMVTLSDHRDGSYRTVFLITDGEANEGGTPNHEADLLKGQNITIHILGISEEASREQLYRLGSRPHNEHVFFLKNYTSLTKMVSLVVNETTEYYNECGISEKTVSRGRVVGGNDASVGAWPWQALYTAKRTNGVLFGNCGGVLIDRRWVVTAAHCVPNENITVESVRLGVTDKNKFAQGQTIPVQEVIRHPEYDFDTFQNDIALLKLQVPAHLNPNVRLVCLPEKSKADLLIPAQPTDRDVAMVTGWGHTKPKAVEENARQDIIHTPAVILQQLALPLRRREECQESIDDTAEEHFFDNSMFCAGFKNARRGACQGDSGGPFVKRAVRQKQRRWTLIGLTSWGRGCAAQNELDFFTNVPYFLDWITEKINPPQEEEEGVGEGEEEGGEGEGDDDGLPAED